MSVAYSTGDGMPYVSPSMRLKLVALRVTMAEIAARVALANDLTLDRLRGSERTREVAWPRQEAFHACYAVMGLDGHHRWSLPQIGRYFGGRDHTTVIWGIRRHEKRVAEAARLASL